GHLDEPGRTDPQGAGHLDAARREGPAHAFRDRREERSDAGGGRDRLRGHPRARPPDRGQGAAQAPASIAVAALACVPRDLGARRLQKGADLAARVVSALDGCMVETFVVTVGPRTYTVALEDLADGKVRAVVDGKERVI